VRAGNVIGGGDFTANGLLADTMQAIFKGESIQLRNPTSTRPWQYVLEPISGYLCLAAHLLQAGHEYAEAWNFGPLQHKAISTQEVVEKLIRLWEAGERTQISADPEGAKLHEAHSLHLNWDKSAARLNWRPVYSIDEALAETVRWYRAYQAGEDMHAVCRAALQNYVHRAQELDVWWSRV
jgi:CDP-glucose 4,6-dehydratase